MRDVVRARPAEATRLAAGALALACAAALASVWALQARGYAPCELCLKERMPLETALPVAALLAVAGARAPRRLARAGYALLVLLFAAGAALGAYHAGVEWHLWAGPSGCSGGAAPAADVAGFLRQLDSVTVVRCDEAALRVLGLSLAAWNALLCLALLGLSAAAWRRA